MYLVNKQNFYFYLILIIASIILSLFNPFLIHGLFVLIFIYNVLIDILFKHLNRNVFKNKNHSVLIVIFSTILRLFLCIVFVFIFGLIGTKKFMLFTINFLILFLLFIIFEITILLFNLHRE